MKTYTQGIANDGAAILEDGLPITIEQIVERLNKLEKITESCKSLLDFLKIRDSDVLKNKKRFDRLLDLEMKLLEDNLH